MDCEGQCLGVDHKKYSITVTYGGNTTRIQDHVLSFADANNMINDLFMAMRTYAITPDKGIMVSVNSSSTKVSIRHVCFKKREDV